MKIEKLTPEQEAVIPEVRDEWLRIGLSCEPCDVERAKAALVKVYAAANLPPPGLVLVMDSPISGAVCAAMLKDRDQIWDRVVDQVGVQVGAQVRAQVWDQVWDRVVDQVGVQVGAQVVEQVWAQVVEQVGAQVRDQVRAQVWDQVWNQVGDQVYGSHDAGWLSFYDFMRRAGVGGTGPLDGLMELARCCGWWAPYKNVAILQHRHSELHRNSANQLHRDGGPAVLYRDGFAVWALNGVRVEKWLAETPAEDLDPRKFAEIENAEIRREFVRKVGIERLCDKLVTKVLDRQGDYELHAVNLGGETGEWPYLKMRNPSIGVYHMEAVSKECRTVEAALNFRNGGPVQHIVPLT